MHAQEAPSCTQAGSTLDSLHPTPPQLHRQTSSTAAGGGSLWLEMAAGAMGLLFAGIMLAVAIKVRSALRVCVWRCLRYLLAVSDDAEP